MSALFYQRPEWHRIRYRVLRKHGFRCMACGRCKQDGAVLQVDHIQPLSKYPELALVEDNLQVLCKDCNMGKSNQYADDFRAKPSPAAPVLVLDDQREAMALGRTLKQEITAAEAKGDGPRQAELMRQARH